MNDFPTRTSAIARLLERAPAPWTATSGRVVFDADEHHVCEVGRDKYALPFIAAIPDMLAALQAANNCQPHWREQVRKLLERLENTP